MGKVIAIANQKGGTGKTSTVSALASGLTRAGKKVLMIDLDAQRSLSRSFNVESESNSIVSVISKAKGIEEVIQSIPQGDIISGRSTIGAIDIILDEADKQFALKDAIEPVIKKYDYILLDCPPALSTITINAFICADKIIIPAEAEKFSLDGVKDIVDTIYKIRDRYNSKLKIAGILITRYDGRTILGKEIKRIFEGMAQALGTKVYKPIRRSVVVGDAQAYGTDIFTLSAKSKVAEDYKALVEDVLQEGE